MLTWFNDSNIRCKGGREEMRFNSKALALSDLGEAKASWEYFGFDPMERYGGQAVLIAAVSSNQLH